MTSMEDELAALMITCLINNCSKSVRKSMCACSLLWSRGSPVILLSMERE